MIRLLLLSTIFLFFGLASSWGQTDYSSPRTYTLGGVRVEGVKFLDKEILVILSGLRVGSDIEIPGEKTAECIRKLWSQGLFDDVQLFIDRVEGDNVFLILELQERPRLSKISFKKKGLKQGWKDDLNDILEGYKSKIVTQNLLNTVELKARNYFKEKGYWDIKFTAEEADDSIVTNSKILKIDIDPGSKMKIREIVFEGNDNVKSSKLLKAMKETKSKRGLFGLVRSAKFNEGDYKTDKRSLVNIYNNLGYRDANIAWDTVAAIPNDGFYIKLKVEEGNQYYFRNIDFTGNTIYVDSILHKLLGVEQGDAYNQGLLQSRLYGDQSGRDITTLYMDNGYLFFELIPVESYSKGDSVDIQVRIREGAQATIGKITVMGNDKTNDHVIIRELRTRPGQKFNRSDIIRSTRELATLGYFDPEQIGVTPFPNPQDGTVDIEYRVVERSADQIELSGGWGAGRLVGSLGLSLTNFSARKVFKKGAWRPIPTGDGQRLSIRGQTNGAFFQNYSASFTEPWLGGKKPISFSVSLYTSIQSNGLSKGQENRQSITIRGAGLTLGKRLKWPDDYFTLSGSINMQRYILNNYRATPFLQNGIANNLYFKGTLSRSNIDQTIYPRSGSLFTLSAQFTPPYSKFNNKDYSTSSTEERYNFIEYHKWRFDASWYIKLVGNLVLNPKMQLGFLGSYTDKIGEVPFGRFFLGGDGITGFSIDDRELIALRGYENNSLTPKNSSNVRIGGTAFQKFVMELRYPVSLNPQATIYVLSFLEGGNNFASIKDFDPFNNIRSAGVGLRVFLPMFGMLGVDYGYGFDDQFVPDSNKKGNIHVSIGQQF